MGVQHQAVKRAHNLLLFKNLLESKDNASPLTLVLDSLEQSAQPLTHEFMRLAKTLKRAKVIFVSFSTVKKPALADVFVRAWSKTLQTIATEITTAITNKQEKHLIVIDSLNTPASLTPHLFPTFFSSVITSPCTTLVAVYHTDIPVLPPSRSALDAGYNPDYSPDPETLLCHLATAVLRVSCLHHEIAAHRARERSLIEPKWGLKEGREGVLIGLRKGNGKGDDSGGAVGLVVEMEVRRRSGRAISGEFVLVPAGQDYKETGLRVMLKGEYPAFKKEVVEEEEEKPEATFDLGLTEKQRRDREGVVLPYFDAQVEVGGGEGGRILYEMGREDDFDEEEDEI